MVRRRRRRGWMIGMMTGITLAAGCNVGKVSTFFERKPPKPPQVLTPPVTTRERVWRGWDTVEQTNGLVTVRHVPAAGGRTLSLEIGADDAIAVFEENAGKVYPVDSREGAVHFGGHYTAIGPETRWNVSEQPFNPHGGPYTYRIDNVGNTHHVSMTSRPDTHMGLTVDIERTITMKRGTTHIVIDEQVTNRGPDPTDFYIWDFTQIDARHANVPGQPLRNLTFYVPLPPERSGRPRFTRFLPPDPAKDAQFTILLEADILAIDFQAQQFKIASHAKDWWVACVDHDTGWTYVKAFDANHLARYVDGNGPIEVYGSNLDSPRPTPFVEMELLGGIDRHRPGTGPKQREHWYAAICVGPVLAFSKAGVVCERLSLQREGETCRLTGRYGVFHLGTAHIEALDMQGKEITRSKSVPIDPRRELLLDTTMEIPRKKRPDMFVLKVFDATGQEVAILDRHGVR